MAHGCMGSPSPELAPDLKKLARLGIGSSDRAAYIHHNTMHAWVKRFVALDLGSSEVHRRPPVGVYVYGVPPAERTHCPKIRWWVVGSSGILSGQSKWHVLRSAAHPLREWTGWTAALRQNLDAWPALSIMMREACLCDDVHISDDEWMEREACHPT